MMFWFKKGGALQDWLSGYAARLAAITSLSLKMPAKYQASATSVRAASLRYCRLAGRNSTSSNLNMR
jgi:hypothetical protein